MMSSLEVEPPPGESESPRRPIRLAWAWGLALLAGTLAGLASWSLGEAIHARFGPPKLVITASPTGGLVSGDEMQRRGMSKRAAQIFEAALTFGSLGAALGLSLGIAGGLAGGSSGATWRAALAGLILAGVAGAAAAEVVLPVYFRVVNPDTNELIVGVMTQLAISCAIGFAAGAAFGLGLGLRNQAVHAASGGALGAVVGALVYEVAGALAFPSDETSSPISATGVTRLIARLAVTLFASAGAAIGALDRRNEEGPR